MIDKVHMIVIKKKFSDVIRELRDDKIIPEDFVGRFQINCNSGGVTSVDANITIR